MPRISAASFRFHRVRVSIRRINSRSASRAAVRAMSFSETLPSPVALPAAETAAAFGPSGGAVGFVANDAGAGAAAVTAGGDTRGGDAITGRSTAAADGG